MGANELDLLTTSGAARVLDRSSDAVRGYERAGKLPAIRTESGVRLFRRADVERFRRERETRTTQQRGEAV